MRHNSGFEPEPPPSHITEGRQNNLAGTVRNYSRIMANEQIHTNSQQQHVGFEGTEDVIENDREEIDRHRNGNYVRLIAQRMDSHIKYNPDGTSNMFAVFLIVNATLGSGLLNFPKTFDDAGGIVAASIVQIILLVFVMVSLIALAYASDQCGTNGAENIQDTMEGMTGRLGRLITSLCMMLYCFGTTITLLIVIGHQFDRTFESFYGPDFADKWYLDHSFTISICACLFILPMCYSRKIDFLQVPSMLGVFAMLYLVALVASEYYTGNYKPGPIKPKPEHFTDVFLAIPSLCFGYQCHFSVIPIYSCMKMRTVKSFTIVASMAIAISVLFYTLTAVYGYLTFGGLVNEDILMSFEGSGQVYAGMYIMVLKIITTYPIFLFCGREAMKSVITDLELFFSSNPEALKEEPILDNEWTEVHNTMAQRMKSRLRRRGDTTTFEGPVGARPIGLPPMMGAWATAAFGRGDNRKELIVRYVCVTLWFVSSLILALVIPNIGGVIKVLGSLSAVFIFILPGLCMLQCALRTEFSSEFLANRRWFFVVCSIIYLALGGSIFGIVFVEAMKGLIAA